MNLQSKLAILADAAKYDASCASSGAAPRNSVGGRGMGSTEGMGICHSYAPDGRCISLLKILLTNFCQYDCLYCVNRVTSNVPRARFTVDEVVQLTLDFYRRNCIEGLFLSSGIIQSPDYTNAKKVPQEKRYLLTKQIYGLAVDSAFIIFVFIVDVCDKPSSRTLQIIQSNISFCGL